MAMCSVCGRCLSGLCFSCCYFAQTQLQGGCMHACQAGGQQPQAGAHAPALPPRLALLAFRHTCSTLFLAQRSPPCCPTRSVGALHAAAQREHFSLYSTLVVGTHWGSALGPLLQAARQHSCLALPPCSSVLGIVGSTRPRWQWQHCTINSWCHATLLAGWPYPLMAMRRCPLPCCGCAAPGHS